MATKRIKVNNPTEYWAALDNIYAHPETFPEYDIYGVDPTQFPGKNLAGMDFGSWIKAMTQRADAKAQEDPQLANLMKSGGTGDIERGDTRLRVENGKITSRDTGSVVKPLMLAGLTMAGGGALAASGVGAGAAAGAGGAASGGGGAAGAAGAAGGAAGATGSTVGAGVVPGLLGPSMETAADVAAAGGGGAFSAGNALKYGAQLAGSLGKSAATNRSENLAANMDAATLQNQREAENRAERTSAWKQLQQAEYMMNNKGYQARAGLPTFGTTGVAPSEAERQGASGMRDEVLKRLMGGKLQDPNYAEMAKPSAWEKMANVAGPALQFSSKIWGN